MRNHLGCAIAAVLVSTATLAAQPASTALRKLCDDYTEFGYRSYPANATFEGRTEFNHLWQDLSPAAIEERARAVVEFRRRLRAIPDGSLSGEDRITAALLDRVFEQREEGEKIGDLLLSAGQMYGLHNRVFGTIDAMPVRTARDYENIIARLNGLPVLIDQQIALLNQAIAEGLTQPGPVLDRVLPQIDSQMAPSAAESPLLAAFRRFPASVPETARPCLTARATEAYDQRFRRAFQ